MERVWMRFSGTDGYFHAPAAAVEDWKQLGWEPSEPPPAVPSPVVAERIAWEQGRQSTPIDAALPAGPEPVEPKTRSRQSAATNPEE